MIKVFLTLALAILAVTNADQETSPGSTASHDRPSTKTFTHRPSTAFHDPPSTKTFTHRPSTASPDRPSTKTFSHRPSTAFHDRPSTKTFHDPPSTTERPSYQSLEQRVKEMENILDGLSRQVMLQQFYVEQKVRSDGNSGVKQIRVTRDGTKNYHSTAHIGVRFLAMHDHANYDRTVGMGELMVVMNGVEFRTRHNDYKLRMPSRKSSGYNAMEYIPFPKVPKSVADKKNVEEQIVEMREYFKAFKTQNVTHRDYRPYFKPVLCYLEGAWTVSKKAIDEPFQSDRHAIDASSWFELMDKVRFSEYSGTKSVKENYAYLPTTIISVENGVPKYAQFNYRILCHPLKEDLPLKQLQLQDDLLYRFPQRMPMNKVHMSRGARFGFNYKQNDHYNSGKGLLDNLMRQIPGKNNYGAEFHDNSFGMTVEDIDYSNHTLLNTGYYHRYFKTLEKGAMGGKGIRRSFSDSNLFAAQTSHPQVAPMSVTNCEKNNCKTWTVRYSYALPLEVIYLTPLYTWNPYDLPTYESNDIVRGAGKRNGETSSEKAFNGTNSRNFYITPANFYSTDDAVSGGKDPADTAKKGAGVLDRNGKVHVMSSSGPRILTQNIPGVGQVRLRYPVMPLHGEGSGVWKELNALKDMTMHMNRYVSLFEERPGHASDANDTDGSRILHYKLPLTHLDPPGEHDHDIFLNVEEVDEVLKYGKVTVTTSEDMGHTHELVLRRNKQGNILIRTCDGRLKCWDGHPSYLKEIKH